MQTMPTLPERWRPSVTVAAIVERDGRFLLVEEETAEGLRLNNPAGHLDPGESPVQACVREALEETAHRVQAQALLGVYLSRFQRPAREPGAGDLGRPAQDVTYLRFAFRCAVIEHLPGLALDQGIVRTLWLTPDEVRASVERHRSPLLLRCVEDHLRGQSFGLDALFTDPSVLAAR